jgi:Protein of unknown function (DUF2846)
VRFTNLIFTSLVVFILVGCAAKPPARSTYSEGTPTLEKGWSRLYFFSGNHVGVGSKPALSTVNQVGPIYINNEQVGLVAENEYVIVDIRPGTYEISCSPQEPDKNFVVKTSISINQGIQRAYACDMDNFSEGQAAKQSVAMAFGLIGALVYEASIDYRSKTYLVESALPNNSRLVSYHKFLGHIGSPASDVNATTSSKIPSKNAAIKSDVDRLKELNTLKKDGLISEADYRRKKQQIIDQM